MVGKPLNVMNPAAHLSRYHSAASSPIDPRTPTAPPLFLEKQFGFARASSAQMRAQIDEVKKKLKEYSLADCRDKVGWLSTIVLQQLLDLELFRCSSLSIEDWTSEQLKAYSKTSREFKAVYRQKKRLDEAEKESAKEKMELKMKKAEAEDAKNALEKQVRELEQYKQKFKQLTNEKGTLRVEKDELQKTFDQIKAENEKLCKFIHPKKLEEVEREREAWKQRASELKKEKDALKQRLVDLEKSEGKNEMKQRINDLEKQLIKAREKKNSEREEEGGGGEENDGGGRDGTASRRAKKELAAKNAQIETMEKEMKELMAFMERAKHKNNSLREKHRTKKEENERLKAELEAERRKKDGKEGAERTDEKVDQERAKRKEEKAKREKAEQEVAKLEEELSNMRKRMAQLEQSAKLAERSKGPTANNGHRRFPAEEFTERLKQVAAREEELKKAILSVRDRQKCDKCRGLEQELIRACRSSEELTAVVYSRDMEIKELRLKVKSASSDSELRQQPGESQPPTAVTNQQLPSTEIRPPPTAGKVAEPLPAEKATQQRAPVEMQKPPIENRQQQPATTTSEEDNKKEEKQEQKAKPEQQQLAAENRRQKRARGNDGGDENDMEKMASNKRQKSQIPVVPETASSIDDVIILEEEPIMNGPLEATLASFAPSSNAQQQQNVVATARANSQPVPALPSPILPSAPQINNILPRPDSVPIQPMYASAQTQQQPSGARQPMVAASPRQNHAESPQQQQQQPAASPEQPPPPSSSPTHTRQQPPPSSLAATLQSEEALALAVEQQPEELQPTPPEELEYQTIAAQIITEFMIFIAQPHNVPRNAETLIPEFIHHTQLPPNPEIANQLRIIAQEAERAKQGRSGGNH